MSESQEAAPLQWQRSVTKYAGVDRYRAGMHMGVDDWMSAANGHEPGGLLRDADVSHWQALPDPPAAAVDAEDL